MLYRLETLARLIRDGCPQLADQDEQTRQDTCCPGLRLLREDGSGTRTRLRKASEVYDCPGEGKKSQ